MDTPETCHVCDGAKGEYYNPAPAPRSSGIAQEWDECPHCEGTGEEPDPDAPPALRRRALYVAGVYGAMPPETMCDIFLNGVWKRMTAADIAVHHLNLFEANRG